MDVFSKSLLRVLAFTSTCFLVACGGAKSGSFTCVPVPQQAQGALARATMDVRSELAAGYIVSLCASSVGQHRCHGYRVTPAGLSALGYERRQTAGSGEACGAFGSAVAPAPQPVVNTQPVAQASGAPVCTYTNSNVVSVGAAAPCPASAPSCSASSNGSNSGGNSSLGYGPADLQAAYGLTCFSQSGGQGRTVAVVIDGDDPQLESTLGVYRSTFGLSACSMASGCLKIVAQDGSSNVPQPSGSTSEEELDVEMISAICPNCHILVVEANSLGTPDMNIAEDTAASLGPVAISNSWGGPPEDASSASHFNHPGIAITVADGDCGYLDDITTGQGCVGNGTGLEYPSDFSTVIAVGGTMLTRNPSSPRGWGETVWPDTGGGCSQVIAKPAWQKDTGCSKRMVGDVAFVGDCTTGVATYEGGSWGIDCGTSVASPAIAAIYGLASASASNASTLYANPGALNDIIAGSNGSCSPTYFCTAGTGYDGPTGLGTPNGIGAF